MWGQYEAISRNGNNCLGFFKSIIHKGTYICDTENVTIMIITTEMARSLSVLSSIHQRQQGQPTQHKTSCCSGGGGMYSRPNQGQKE